MREGLAFFWGTAQAFDRTGLKLLNGLAPSAHSWGDEPRARRMVTSETSLRSIGAYMNGAGNPFAARLRATFQANKDSKMRSKRKRKVSTHVAIAHAALGITAGAHAAEVQ